VLTSGGEKRKRPESAGDGGGVDGRRLGAGWRRRIGEESGTRRRLGQRAGSRRSPYIAIRAQAFVARTPRPRKEELDFLFF
jgi:hypothetical protein